MPHLYPELIFFLLVSVVPAAIVYRAQEVRAISLANLLIVTGCLLLSLSWVVDYALHQSVGGSVSAASDFAVPHMLLAIFGFVPGAALVGFGFASWARESAALRTEIALRLETEAKLEKVSRRLEEEALRAEQADKAKADFLANMSHDLRTPLNAIMGFSEMMHAEMFGELGAVQYKEYLDAINSSSRQLHDSISDMLDLSKATSGQMRLRRQDLVLRKLADECIDMLRPQAEAKDVSLEGNFAADLVINADRRMLFQVLLNLLTNAIKCTPKYGKVSLVVLQQTDGRPVIIVRDTGYGMSSEDIELATAPFEHTESLLARSHEGLAIQLALVNKFIELHDGQLMIDSKADFGTCTTIKLPPVPQQQVFESDNVVSVA